MIPTLEVPSSNHYIVGTLHFYASKGGRCNHFTTVQRLSFSRQLIGHCIRQHLIGSTTNKAVAHLILVRCPLRIQRDVLRHFCTKIIGLSSLSIRIPTLEHKISFRRFGGFISRFSTIHFLRSNGAASHGIKVNSITYLSPRNGEVKCFCCILTIFFDLYFQSGSAVKGIVVVLIKQLLLNTIRVNRHSIGLDIGVVCGISTRSGTFLEVVKIPVGSCFSIKGARTYTIRKSIMHLTSRESAGDRIRNFLERFVQLASIICVIGIRFTSFLACNAIF